MYINDVIKTMKDQYKFSYPSKECISNISWARNSISVYKVNPEQDNLFMMAYTNGNYEPKYTEPFYSLDYFESNRALPVISKQFNDIRKTILDYICLIMVKMKAKAFSKMGAQYNNVQYFVKSEWTTRSVLYVYGEAYEYFEYYLNKFFKEWNVDKNVIYTEYGVIRP